MIVLDSSFLIAYHNERDAHHPAARTVMADLVEGRWGKGLLPEYVFLEVVTVLRARRGIEIAADVGRVLLEAKELEFVSCSDVFSQAWSLFVTQGRAELSFADSAIAVIARREDPSLIATFDHDFREVAGITVVP